MLSTIGQKLFSYSGETFVRANGTELSIFRFDKIVYQFSLKNATEWLKIAPDGKTVLIFTNHGTHIWRWRENFGIDLFLEKTDNRDIIGCDFVSDGKRIITLACKNGLLSATSNEGLDLFTSNLKSPHTFFPWNFIQLSEDHIAVTGSFFSDFCDVTVSLKLNNLMNNQNAIQQAIKEKKPLWDRAAEIAVGPGNDGSIVVMRNPEDNEEPDEDADSFPNGEVWNFRGIYLRNVQTGSLIEKHPYNKSIGNGASIVATKEWIFIQVFGGVDIIHRKTNEIKIVPDSILDVQGLKICNVADDYVSNIITLNQFVY